MGKQKLLPYAYKKVGWTVLILSLPLAIVLRKIGLTADDSADIGCIVSILGFAIVIGSVEKDEDERTMLCRYKAMASAFITFLSGIMVSKIFHLSNFFQHIAQNPGYWRDETSFFDSPMGLLYFSATFYFISFRQYKDEE